MPPDSPTALPVYLDKLNDEQRAAVLHGTETLGSPGARALETGGGAEGTLLHDTRPLLVIAGAGSGKTNTLAHRVAHLIVSGVDPRRILLLTFTRRAASEMGRRVDRIIRATMGGSASIEALAWSGTFHAIGARLLRECAEEIGLSPSFTIHDREDSADLMNLVRHELGFSEKKSRFPTKGTCLAIYSRAVNAALPLSEVLPLAFPWCADWEEELRTLFGAYVEAKQAEGVLDYDDLLLYWAQMVSEPALAARVGERFDHILVDEYQDTNRLQANILLALKPSGAGLTVVGDDAQSIYSFRAATVRNILDFPAAFEPSARVVTLDRNYRSTQPILTAANAVIALAAERFTKDLRSDRIAGDRPDLVTVADESAQADYIVERVLANREAGQLLKAQAVLFRTAHHSGPLEVELTRRKIPFVKYGGLKFLDSAHVKDVLALLRFAENPRDRIAGFRVLQLLPGLGPATAAEILERLAAEPDRPFAAFEPSARVAAPWEGFAALVDGLRSGDAPWPAQLDRVRRWYEPILESQHDDAALRIADLLQLEQIASGYPSRERFLTELTLDPPEATGGHAVDPMLDEDFLILSTIHSAKGLEWSSVFVLNAVDGCIPSDMAGSTPEEYEEERRLLYVAMTRAKDHLTLMVPQRFYVHHQPKNGDRHLYAIRSRFIPKEMLPLFRDHFWPPPSAAMPRPGERVQPIDIGAKMRAMWR